MHHQPSRNIPFENHMLAPLRPVPAALSRRPQSKREARELDAARRDWYLSQLYEREASFRAATADNFVWNEIEAAIRKDYPRLIEHLPALRAVSQGFGTDYLRRMMWPPNGPAIHTTTGGVKTLQFDDDAWRARVQDTLPLPVELRLVSAPWPLLRLWARWLEIRHRQLPSPRRLRKMRRITREAREEFPDDATRPMQVATETATEQVLAVRAALQELRPLRHESKNAADNNAIVELVPALVKCEMSEYEAEHLVATRLRLSYEAVRARLARHRRKRSTTVESD